MSKRYFAYGSNLCIDQMTERMGAVRQGNDQPRIARLANYRLVFNVQGDDGHVYANLAPAESAVFGVVYRCSAECLLKMDTYETGYVRRHVRVVLENGDEVDAATYIAEVANEVSVSGTSPEYLQKILRGARRHGLPEAYIRTLERAGL